MLWKMNVSNSCDVSNTRSLTVGPINGKAVEPGFEASVESSPTMLTVVGIRHIW